MRIIKNSNGFELVHLGKAEKAKLLDKLRTENKAIMQQCMKDAMAICSEKYEHFEATHVEDVACTLFDKLATKFFTLVTDAETVRAFNEKELAKAEASAYHPKDRTQANKELV